MERATILGLRGYNGEQIISLKDLLPPEPAKIPRPPGPPFTGDYDALDFIDKSGNRVISESADEQNMCRVMNQAVRGVVGEKTNVVQHGPQAAYLDYMKSHGGVMMTPQLQPALPILAFDKNGNTYYFGTQDKASLAAFYQCKCGTGQEIPPSWNLSQGQCEELTDQWNQSALAVHH